jgi:predicted esterase
MVSEQGMAQFFRRLREGVFDEDDLRLRVDELAAFLTAAEQEYDVMATPEQTSRLTEQLRRRDADVELLPFSGGHTIDPGQLPRIKRFIDASRLS